MLQDIKTIAILWVIITIVTAINGVILDKYNYWKEQKTFQEMVGCKEISYANDFIVCE